MTESESERRREREALPRMAAYLAALPAGVRSFPDCQADAALLRGLVAAGAVEGLALGGDLRRVVGRAASGAEGWVPEVAHVAVLLALRDARFAGPGGDEALVRWLAEASRPLVAAGPEGGRAARDAAAAVRDVPEVWARHHRGTPIEVLEVGARRAHLLHHHPDAIFPRLAHEWRRRVVLSMLARAGAARPVVTASARPGVGTAITLAW